MPVRREPCGRCESKRVKRGDESTHVLGSGAMFWGLFLVSYLAWAILTAGSRTGSLGSNGPQLISHVAMLGGALGLLILLIYYRRRLRCEDCGKSWIPTGA